MEMRKIQGINFAHLRADILRTYLYDELAIYSMESPNAYVTEKGRNTLDENGECLVVIDERFTEVANTNIEYYIDLTGIGTSDVYIEENSIQYNQFIVKGTPNKSFFWSITAEKFGAEGLKYNDLIGMFPDEVDEKYILQIEEEILEPPTGVIEFEYVPEEIIPPIKEDWVDAFAEGGE